MKRLLNAFLSSFLTILGFCMGIAFGLWYTHSNIIACLGIP